MDFLFQILSIFFEGLLACLGKLFSRRPAFWERSLVVPRASTAFLVLAADIFTRHIRSLHIIHGIQEWYYD